MDNGNQTFDFTGAVCFIRNLLDLFSSEYYKLKSSIEEYEARRSECYSNIEYNWDMASVCAESGFESTECKVEGSITIFGVELSGSYEKGNTYSIPWARYECRNSDGNCCIKQGLYTGDQKLA